MKRNLILKIDISWAHNMRGRRRNKKKFRSESLTLLEDGTTFFKGESNYRASNFEVRGGEKNSITGVFGNDFNHDDTRTHIIWTVKHEI